jgi:hypothetical protein
MSFSDKQVFRVLGAKDLASDGQIFIIRLHQVGMDQSHPSLVLLMSLVTAKVTVHGHHTVERKIFWKPSCKSITNTAVRGRIT